ncbi:MAG: dTMP kinase [Coxiella sp. RIFCSPHIGHO2_12_FULL_42_15]|nr:MAG: dTMP kinase [Coxiella sp. RIFCSPHIGHO2_12_FULL_42_15]
MKNKQGYFVSLEGIEGVGKSTALQFLQRYLQQHSISVVFTREPGGTPIAEAIRQVLLGHYTEPMTSDTELLLMFAGRAQNIAQVILPALQRGQWVLSDRFTDASFAYQGGGRGIATQHIIELARWVQKDLQPDLTFLLDAPVEVGLQRVSGRGAKDRIEAEGIEFFKRVRAAYLGLAEREPERFYVIDATQEVAQVQQHMVHALQPIMETL